MPFDVVVMARIGVVPIDDVRIAVRPVANMENLRRQVAGKQKVRTMAANKPGPVRLQDSGIEPLPMNVVHEDATAILVPPRATHAKHRARMRVTAGRIARATLSTG